MGAGAGAAAAIENEPSPRRAAIEKAQAELRREVAVREERRRELEFLEKGGESLDFFTATTNPALPPFSPTDPLADQLVSSEAEGGYASTPLANEDSLENSVGASCFVRRGSEAGDHRIGDDGASTASQSLASPWEGRVRAPRTVSSSLRSQADVNLKRDSESSSGVRTAVGKGQTYSRRNRQRSNRFSNGYAQAREVEKAVESSSTPSFELKSPTPAAASLVSSVEASKGNESMVEKNVQPLLVHLALPNTASGNNKLSVGSNVKATNDHQEGSALSHVKLPADQNFSKHALPNANAGVDLGKPQSLSRDPAIVDDFVILSRNSDVKDSSCTDFNVKEDLLVGADSEKLDPLPLVPCLEDSVGVRESSATSQPLNLKQVSCSNPVAVDSKEGALPVAVKDESVATMVREKSAVSSQVGPHATKSECKRKSPIRVGDSQAQRVLDRGTTMPSNHVRDSSTPVHSIDDKRFVQLEAAAAPLQVTSMSLDSSENRSNNTRKTTSTASTDVLNRTKGDNRVMANDKALEPARVQVKIEEVSDMGTRLSGVEMEAESGHGRDVKSACTISLPQEEVKVEGQSTPVSQGSNRTGFRTPNSFTASNKFPGVVLPWEKEKDPNHIAEAERHKANLSAKARKAHEEYIIEEAGLIQKRKGDAAEWEKRNPESEPMKRKSHWAFVLEEMAWMANDFMQERLWKMASATQFCRWTAQLKGQPEFQARDLQRRQRRIAKIFANSVKEFWRTMELSPCKEKAPAVNGEVEELPANVKDNGDAVPMEVDQPPVGKASTQQHSKQKLSKRSLPVQAYAKRFLKELRGSDLAAQAEAPSTPDRISESSSILDPLWEDQFPEEPLFYTVPNGAFEAYRHSIEAQRALIEAEYEQTVQEQAAALAEAEAQAVAEAVATSEFIVSGVEESQSLTGLSSPMKGMHGDDDGAQYGGLPHSSIAKKKRKNILKSTPKVEGGLPSSALSRPSGLSFVEGFGSGGSLPSPAVTAKRSLPTSSAPTSAMVGSIPTKRMRSGTARQRPLGTASPSSFPSPVVGITSRPTFSSGALNSNHEEVNNMTDSTISTRTEGGAAPSASKNVIGGGSNNNNSFISSKSKKKAKKKQFSGALSSKFKGDGAASGNTGSSLKPVESEHHSMYEQVKRKGDQLHSSSLEPATGGMGSSAETPETPASQGQQPSKKVKLSKQTSDINSDTAPTAVTVSAAQSGSVTANTSSTSKLLRQNSNRDRNRKSRSNKLSVSQPAGIGIPWSTIEDQAILALVHDLGANWELVSDVLSSSSQLKGIFRRPKQCKDRHKALMERLAVAEGGDSPDDPSTSQPHPSTLPGIPKGSARVLLQRFQGPMEEDTLKVHLEHIVRVVHKFKALKPQVEEQKLLPPHSSHLNTASQLCNSSLSGGFVNPVDLIKMIREAEKKREEELAGLGQPYQMPGTHLPGALPAGSGVRPTTNGMPVIPGPGNLHIGGVPAMAPSNAAVTAARDVHRLAAMRPFSPEEAQRVRYAQAMAARRLPVPGASVTAGLPMMALPNPNDCAVPMLAAGNSVGMMGGLSRGMSLSRAGLPGMSSPGVSGMGSPTLGTMLPPGGVGMVGAAGSSVGPAGVPSQVNSMRRPRDQMGRPVRTSEEQRLFIQELQHQAAQGMTEAQTHLSTLNRDPSNPLIVAPSQNFPTPQHPNQQQQQFLAARMFKERQQLQQQQHKQRLLQQQLQQNSASHSLPLQQQQQLHAMSQQHVLPQQAAHLQQHQHLLPQQLSLQKQQTPPLPSSPMQPMASPPMPSNHQQQQHQTLSQSQQQPQQQSQQPTGQVPQLSVQSKVQPKQSQKHLQQSAQALQQQQQQQQQQSRGSKGVARGSMMMQQPGQSSMLPGNVGIGQQFPGQAISHSMPGQRPLQPQVPMSMGKQLSQGGPQGGMTGQAGSMQGQQNQTNAGSAGQQQQKALQQPSQMPLAPKQQQASHPSHAQQTPASTAQAQLSPSSQQPQIAAPSQQPQQRRQPQQQTQMQQSGQRRLQQRQQGSSIGGAQTSGQLVKNGTSLQGQVSQPAAAQSGHATYPLGTSIASSMGMMGAPGASGITSLGNSSPSGVHSTQWKPGQNVTPMSTGIYNLTRSGNSGTAMPSIVNSAAMHMASPNGGSSGMPSSSIHGLNISGLPQSHQVGQKVGIPPGTNSRPMTAATAQGTQRPLQQQQQHHGNLPMSLPMGGVAGQVKPPAVPASSGAVIAASSLGGTSAQSGVPQSGSMAFQGSSSPAAGHSAPMANAIPAFGSQPRQSALNTATLPQKSVAATTTANSTSSGVSASSSPASLISSSSAAVNSTVATDQTTSS